MRALVNKYVSKYESRETGFVEGFTLKKSEIDNQSESKKNIYRKLCSKSKSVPSIFNKYYVWANNLDVYPGKSKTSKMTKNISQYTT